MISFVIAAMFLFSGSNTEMLMAGKDPGEFRITNVLGEEYCVPNYMDPISRIVYFDTNGLPCGLYFIRYGEKSEIISIPQ